MLDRIKEKKRERSTSLSGERSRRASVINHRKENLNADRVFEEKGFP